MRFRSDRAVVRAVVLSTAVVLGGSILAPSAGAAIGRGKISELGTGRIAGIRIGTRADLPDKAALDRAAAAKTCAYEEHDGAPEPYLLLKDFDRTGDFESLRIVLAPEGGSAARVVAVVAEPRYPYAIALAAPEEQAAYLGLKLGELALVHPIDGPLFATSRDDRFAVLLRDGENVFLTRVVVVYDPEWRRASPLVSLDDLDRLAAASPEAVLSAKPALDQAAAAGSRVAAAAIERVRSLREDLVLRRLAERRPAFEAGSPFDRLGAVTEARGWILDAKALEDVPLSKAEQEVSRWCRELEPQLAERSKEARAAGRRYESGGWFALLDLLGDACSGRRVEVTAAGAAEAFEAARAVDAMGLEDRVRRVKQIQMTCHMSDSAAIGPLSGALGHLLLEDLAASAREASSRELHATAAFRWLLAHQAEAGARAAKHVPPTTLREALEVPLDAGSPPLAQARREAAQLALAVIPLPETGKASNDPVLAPFDDGSILAGTPAGKRLGLLTGGRDSLDALAASSGAERFVFEITGPSVTLERADREETASVTLASTRRVDNSSAVGEWEREMQDLAKEIQELQDSIASDRAAAQTVTAVHGFVTEKYVGSSNGTSYYRDVKETERLSSIKGRLEAAGRADRGADHLEQLLERYESRSALRPPGARFETIERVVPYERELQVWKVDATREARLVGPVTKHEMKGHQSFELTYERVAADPANRIEGVDQWRSEQELRADSSLWDAAIPSYARLLLANHLARRLRELNARIEKRGLPESESYDERYLTQWFFRDPSAIEDPAVVKGLEDRNAFVDAVGRPACGEAPDALRLAPSTTGPVR